MLMNMTLAVRARVAVAERPTTLRKNGRLESGFSESDFISTLQARARSVRKDVCTETPWGVISSATRWTDSAPPS
jgi:hypothetical protein